ncbi:MAG: metal-dependent transcriptional regulator [Thermoplasmatota archaeon]
MPREETDEYLEAILDLERRDGGARTSTLSRRLGVAPASVTEALQRLSRAGMVRYRRYRGASLTRSGHRRAERLKRKHRLLEVFLTKVLKMRPRKAHYEACRMEHSLSDDTERALCRSLGGPETCPHGGPIPPCEPGGPRCEGCTQTAQGGGEGRRTAPLTSLAPGAEASVVTVRGGRGLVKRLAEMGLTPGTRIRLLRAAPLKGPVEIQVRGCCLAIGRGIASRILVES